MIEEYILGRELTVPFLHGEILPAIEIITRDGVTILMQNIIGLITITFAPPTLKNQNGKN